MKMASTLRGMTTQASTNLVLTVMTLTEMGNYLTHQNLGIKKILRKVQDLKRSFLKQACFMNVMVTTRRALRALGVDNSGDLTRERFDD